MVREELRGRHLYTYDIEDEIFNILKDTKTPIGSRAIHEKLGHGSKTTLTEKLRLLQTQNIISKTKNRKYQIESKYDFSSNIQSLKIFLNNLNYIIPELTDREKAHIGIKLWTTIFQGLSHPAESFLTNDFVEISEEGSDSEHTKHIEEFFALQKFTNMYLNDMYIIFFDFCREFSHEILYDVLSENIFYKHNKLISDDEKDIFLAEQFHKEILIQGFDDGTYYGIEFCNALLEIKPDAFNEETLERLQKQKLFPEKLI